MTQLPAGKRTADAIGLFVIHPFANTHGADGWREDPLENPDWVDGPARADSGRPERAPTQAFEAICGCPLAVTVELLGRRRHPLPS